TSRSAPARFRRKARSGSGSPIVRSATLTFCTRSRAAPSGGVGMDKRYVHYEAINNEPDDPEREIEMYYASDVDARIAELEKALRLIAEHKGKALLGDG